jgi:hypothetical protein
MPAQGWADTRRLLVGSVDLTFRQARNGHIYRPYRNEKRNELDTRDTHVLPYQGEIEWIRHGQS